MSDDCKEAKTEVTPETLTELKTALDTDPIMFFEPIEIDVDKQLDTEEFTKGLKDASHACGMYTALLSVGFTQEDAVSYVFNFMNVSHNIETAKINANSSIEVSKNVALVKEKDML